MTFLGLDTWIKFIPAVTSCFGLTEKTLIGEAILRPTEKCFRLELDKVDVRDFRLETLRHTATLHRYICHVPIQALQPSEDPAYTLESQNH